MGLLYTATSVSSYNANPPPDDGSQVASNLVTWANIKIKLADPLNTFAGSVDGNITSAFGKTLDGGSVVSTAVSYPASSADQGRLICVTASGTTITTPDATSVTAPFMFVVNNQSSGVVTLKGFGSQNIDGANTQTMAAGSGAVIKTDGSNWFTYGLKAAQVAGGGGGGGVQFGFDMPVALQLNASTAANILTVAIKNSAGNDPSVGNPVQIPFRDASLANGDPVWVNVTSALSISTFATGATLGTQNNVPFRLWIAVFNNSGTPVLALWHSGAGASNYGISPISEYGVASTTSISGAATSAGTFYTPNGTSLTNQPYRLIGFLTYETALAVAGTYAVGPNTVQLFGPGIPRPGEVMHIKFQSGGTTFTFTPTSAANLVMINANAVCSASTSGAGSATVGATFKSGANNMRAPTMTVSGNAAGTLTGDFSCSHLDNPQTSSGINYSVAPNNGGVAGAGTISAFRLIMQEIMG